MPDADPGSSPAPPPEDRRRPRWAELRHAYPGLIATMGVALLVLLAMDVWILTKRRRYEGEIVRLRASMTDLERSRADEIVRQEENKLRVAIALLRRQAQVERTMHLSVTVDSNAMYLEREGAMLRVMPVQIGPERTVGIGADTVRMAAPRGVRTIAKVLSAGDAWDVPAWIFADRGLTVPTDRAVRGALGPAALVLDGGTVIYSMPTSGPLNDSTYVLPGGVRARSEDLRVILPSLAAGMRVYFY